MLACLNTFAQMVWAPLMYRTEVSTAPRTVGGVLSAQEGRAAIAIRPSIKVPTEITLRNEIGFSFGFRKSVDGNGSFLEVEGIHAIIAVLASIAHICPIRCTIVAEVCAPSSTTIADCASWRRSWAALTRTVHVWFLDLPPLAALAPVCAARLGMTAATMVVARP